MTVALHAACGGGGGGGLTEPTTGSLAVVTNTTGTELDTDGYMLTVDGVENGVIGPAAARTVAELEPGPHQIGLAGLAANCG
ncbi:MAG TPA: hypothetical protein VF061_00655, partial [Gemmatimonadales bacterium]